MTLLERNLWLLEATGVDSALILHPPGDTLPPLTALPRKLQLELYGAAVEVAATDPLAILPALRFELRQPFLFLEANLLVDPRAIETLLWQTPPCFLVMGNGADHAPAWRVGWFKAEHWSLGNRVLQRANRVSLTAVPPYRTELRAEVPSYCEKISDEEDLDRGWQLLIDRAAKRPADVIEQHVTPPLENWLVRKLCDTRATPHLVTLLAVAGTVAGAALFYQGWFFLAVFFAWTAIVLDGVTGKLARIKLLTLPVSGFEHLVDFFSENAWYLALAGNLAHRHGPTAWYVGLAITGCDMFNTVIDMLFVRLKGKRLDEMFLFDQRFRLVAGCRSIYLLILCVGFLLGFPFFALQAVLGWAGVTLLIHLGRASFHLLRS
jgi:phosphatidylglycerophosphate synthase